MTYTPPGQEPQQPQQPSYSTPAQQPSYAAPQSSYSTPQHGQNPYAGYAAPKPKSDKKTLGLWGMILGLSGLLIPLYINNIAAIALGIVGLIKENSKGMSITAIVSGAIGLIWAPFAWTIAAGLFLFLIAGGAYYVS